MKIKKKAILRKLGMILALALLFTALAVPAWAEEGDDDNSTPPASSTAPTSLPSEAALSSGKPTVVGYTVTDAAGGEIQRIEPGQKCRIIIAVVDSRIVPDNEEQKAIISQNIGINVKVTSTKYFDSPSLGDITTTTITPDKVTSSGLEYAIILNDITYRGGEGESANELALDISYSGYTYPLSLSTVTQAISQCVNPTETVGEAGKLVITSTSYGGGSVEAGKDFTLTVDVLASKGTADIENVQVSLSLPEHFTVANGSSDIFIGDMKPNTSRQVSFLLTASAVTPSGSQNIGVEVISTTEGAGALKSIAVPVTQPERFEISRTDLPEYLSMGEEGYAYVSFVNKGKGTIYNVSAEITGEGITTTEGNQYIGNVQSGSESSADFTIQTSQAGNISALLTITYEDEKGNIKELTQDFTITVEEMYMGGMDDFYPGDFGDIDVMPEENTGMPVWGWILIVLGVLAAGGGAAFFIIKKKKAKQKAAQLTEDDDEDI